MRHPAAPACVGQRPCLTYRNIRPDCAHRRHRPSCRRRPVAIMPDSVVQGRSASGHVSRRVALRKSGRGTRGSSNFHRYRRTECRPLVQSMTAGDLHQPSCRTHGRPLDRYTRLSRSEREGLQRVAPVARRKASRGRCSSRSSRGQNTRYGP